VDVKRFHQELSQVSESLKKAKRVLITAPGTADGDSIGAQLALRKMILQKFPHLQVFIVNDEPLPPRYLFLPNVETVDTPDTLLSKKESTQYDVGFIVDGGVDRAGRVKAYFDACPVKVFIDHHAISADYPYTIKIVDKTASSTTELMYYLSQTHFFETKVDTDFSQHIYLGLIFDTGFFRHSNTTPEVMELAAKLLRTGFDFTSVGERGMLERTFASLKLLSDTLSRAELRAGGKVIFSTLTQQNLKTFNATEDDREGIIDHLFLTHGIKVAALFFEQANGNRTKVSFRSQGEVDVAKFARSLTEQGGGHIKAAGANIPKPIHEATEWTLNQLEKLLK
jgi:phosphoesterase RecJ-like protein